VAVSLRPDDIFGDATPGGGRALASSSFTGLVNGFFLSMAALIPGSNLGISAAILAVVCLSSTVRSHRSVGATRSSVLTSLLSIVGDDHAVHGCAAAGVVTSEGKGSDARGEGPPAVVRLRCYALSRNHAAKNGFATR
jgi:hypothetical protein